MSQTFDVPKTIPLSKVLAFLADLGLPAEDLVEMSVGIGGIHVELVARGEDGKHYLAGDELARHQIAIRLDRDA